MNLLSTVFDCSKYACNKIKGNYIRYYIAFDVRSIHILRLMDGINEDFDEEEGCLLLEHEMVDYYPTIISYFEEEQLIDKEYKGDDRVFIDFVSKKMSMPDILKAVVDWDENNGLENYDYQVFRDEDVNEIVDEYIIKSDSLSNITI